MSYNIVSWNVDGYTEVIHSWVKFFLSEKKPDVMFFNETKKKEDILKGFFDTLTDYNYILNVHMPACWHGVAVLIRKGIPYRQCDINLDIETRSDTKCDDAARGRIIGLEIDSKFILLGTYVPNSGFGRSGSEKKYNYRINTWDTALYALLNDYRSSKPVVWIGDINVALDDIDVSNPKTMCKCPGFTPGERESFRKFLENKDWVDIWRSKNPDTKFYTWISHTPRKNYGMRLDNVIVSKDLADFAEPYMVQCTLSDHIPIGTIVTFPEK